MAKTKYQCSICHSDKLEQRAYVDANTHKFVEIQDGEQDIFWCPVCEDYVTAERVEVDNDKG